MYGGNGIGRKTAAAGTAINGLVPPRFGNFARVSKIVYTAAGTAHVVTVLRSLGTTTVASAGAAGQAVVNLIANPGPAGNLLAAGDWVAIRTRSDGITRHYQVLSIAALAVTLASNLAVAVAAGDKVWDLGVAADTDPRTGDPHPGLSAPASTTTSYSDTTDNGVVASVGTDEPLLVQSNNLTAAGTLEQVSYGYTRE